MESFRLALADPRAEQITGSSEFFLQKAIA